MKKITLTIIIFLIITISIILIYPKEEKEIMNTKAENKNNMLSIMVESEGGTGKYIDASNFPSNGYYLNKKLSKCINGSKISFSEGNLIIKGNKSDRCYAYFDKDELGSICRGQNLSECFTQNYRKDSTIIYHDGMADYDGEENYELEAGDLSYRYTGASDVVKNYVCLDNKDNGVCADEDLYRIIGLFRNSEDKYEIKLIKATLATKNELGDANAKISENDSMPSAYYWETNYYWNTSNGTTEADNNTNMWQYSNLNKVNLNSYFYKYIITRAKNLQNHITEHTWITGGYSSNDINTKMVYESELGANKIKLGDNVCYAQNDSVTKINCKQEDLEYKDHIGLMYVSDYMYGTLSKYWSTTGVNYSDENVRINNWLYSEAWEWTISRIAYRSDNAFRISFYGNININFNIYNGSVIRPSFYLTTDTKLKEGNGSKENPYRLSWN